MTRIVKPKVIEIPTEDQEQTKLCVWMEKNNILFFAIPNGGYRSLKEAVKFKRCGVKSGIPDLCIPVPRKCYHGLYIELKRIKGGNISYNQHWWIDELTKNGYLVKICYGFEQAKTVVEEYFKD